MDYYSEEEEDVLKSYKKGEVENIFEDWPKFSMHYSGLYKQDLYFALKRSNPIFEDKEIWIQQIGRKDIVFSMQSNDGNRKGLLKGFYSPLKEL